MPVALVTGSDSGIGKATAARLARGGYDLHVTYNRDEEGARDTAREVETLGRAAGRGGVIVNVTSVHEHIPNSDAAAYCAAKGGLGLVTKALALDWARYGVRVNAVAPGEISTPMTGQEDEDPDRQDRPGIPARRTGHAHEIAATIAFLCSEEASYVTGASFVVDGGLMLMAAMQDRKAP